MKFSLNVKPLASALELAVIQTNISKFFEKSTVIQLSVQDDILTLNTQVTSLLSEVSITGNNEDKGIADAIVDCTLFKQLINTIESNEITLDFQDMLLIVQSGKSKFNIPKLFTEEDEVKLDGPKPEQEIQDSFCGELHPEIWKTIQEHQLYSVAMSQLYKVYTRIWVSKDKGVIAGDYSTSIFTYQPTSDLDSSCLVSPTIVNLLAMIEGDTKLYNIDSDNYVVSVHTDAYDFRAQFTVEHEDENGIGVYASDAIFSMIFDETAEPVKVNLDAVRRNVKQGLLFQTSMDRLIFLEAKEDGIWLVNDNINCNIYKEAYDTSYRVGFNINELDTVISHMQKDDLLISPIIKDEEVYGIRFQSGDMVALVGGIED